MTKKTPQQTIRAEQAKIAAELIKAMEAQFKEANDKAKKDFEETLDNFNVRVSKTLEDLDSMDILGNGLLKGLEGLARTGKLTPRSVANTFATALVPTIKGFFSNKSPSSGQQAASILSFLEKGKRNL